MVLNDSLRLRVHMWDRLQPVMPFDDHPHSEPAVGMLDGYFTERPGILPSVPWPTSVGW